MANYYQQPRIVVEQSPWQTLFDKLPDTLLSFHKLKLQAEEKQKDRQFRESQLYLSDKLETKRTLQKALIDATNDARDRGITTNTNLDAIFNRTPEAATSKVRNVSSDLGDMIAYDVDNLSDMFQNLNDDIKIADLGAKDALAIDTNFNGILDSGEMEKFKKTDPAILKALGVKEFPRPYIEGVIGHLADPEVRKQQEENKKLHARLNILKGWDLDPLTPGIELDPRDARYEHQKAALQLYAIDPKDDKITTSIVDAINAEDNVSPFKLYGQTWTSVGSGYASTPEGKKERAAETIVQHPDKYRGMWFRPEYPAGTSSEEKNILNQRKDVDKHYRGMQNNLRGIGRRVSDRFNTNLAWDPAMEELPGADTFHELGPTHRKNIAKNFATWFTQKTQEGNDADNNAPSWMANVFNQNGSWEDVERAVAAVMDDPRFAPIVSDPEVLNKTFNWKGSKYKEDAANEFFMRSFEMFNLTEKALGRDADYSFLKGVSKVGEIDSMMQSDLDLFNKLVPKGGK